MNQTILNNGVCRVLKDWDFDKSIFENWLVCGFMEWIYIVVNS